MILGRSNGGGLQCRTIPTQQLPAPSRGFEGKLRLAQEHTDMAPPAERWESKQLKAGQIGPNDMGWSCGIPSPLTEIRPWGSRPGAVDRAEGVSWGVSSAKHAWTTASYGKGRYPKWHWGNRGEGCWGAAPGGKAAVGRG